MQFTTAFSYITAITTACGAAISFSVSEVITNEGLLPSGPDALRRAYLKYGAELPSSLIARAMVNGSVTATPTQYDTTYLIPVAIGVPPSTYTMLPDTGSTDFSVTAPKLGTPGTSVTTTVNIGGVSVVKQVVNLSKDSSGDMNIVGLAPVGKNFYTNAVSQGTISPVFTAKLKKGAPGVYRFGYISTADYSGTITYVTADPSNGFWMFNGTGYAIGSGAFVSVGNTGIVDTGTTLLFLPKSVVTAYYKQVSGASYSNDDGGYIFPCASTLPDLVLGIGSYRAKVPGSYLNYAPLDDGSSSCFGGVQPDTGIGFSVYGLVFIKSQFVVFKGTTSPSLGFAKQS